MSRTDDLLKNNAAFAEGFDAAGLPVPPARGVAVVTCMDARIDVYRMLGLEKGDAHVIRNAGGVVTDDEIRSLLISQRLLGTTEVMLVQHTDCGMQKFSSEGLKDEIEAETGVRPPFDLETFTDLEENVRTSVERIKSSPFIPHRDAVRGFVYDVGTGKLSEVT